MIYSSQNCPYCKAFAGTGETTSTEVGNPFVRCRNCGKIMLSPHRKEWITITPMKRAMIKGLRIFNKGELNSRIETSLRRTKIIEYVDKLKSAGFKFYPIEGYELSTKHDEAVDYSLANYYYPEDSGERIKRQELPQVKEFAFNGYDSAVRSLGLTESLNLGTLGHEDRVYFAFRSFKIELIDALFPGGIIEADNIIKEFAGFMNVDLRRKDAVDYFQILMLYCELLEETVMEHSQSEIIANIMKKYPNTFSREEAELFLTYFKR